jgi:glutathione S-transferase
MGESWDIALYLDKTYPDAPALMADDAARARAKFVESWCNATVFAPLRPIAVMSVFKIIAEKDKAYFRESRERMLKTRLEEISTDAVAEAAALNKALRPAADAFEQSPFLGGGKPDYSDYILFGTLMWPYMVCTKNPIDMTGSLGKWLDRMLDLHDGFARNSPTARSNQVS